MIINAMAVREPGDYLNPWTYEYSSPQPWECLIKVLACGICHSDVHMMDNDWQLSTYPLVPGHEVVGEVVEVGTHVAHLKPGDRVGVGWQRSACLTCPSCLKGDENLCASNKAVIVGNHGGFADHLVMDSRFCFPLPPGVETKSGGPLMCGGITVYAALRHAGMTSGQEIGVIGVGGLGHMAVKFASKMGNRVTAFTTSDDKAEFATQLGASDAVVIKKGDAMPETIPRPLDIIINTVPHHLDWNGYLNLLGPDGTLTFVGVPAGPSDIDLMSLIFKRLRVMASPIGGRAMITEMLDAADRFEVEPIIETFPLADANDAIEKVRNNTIRYRAVLTV